MLWCADYKASDSSVPVTAKKEIKLLRLPKILVLHMCRFTYAERGMIKLHNKMEFANKLRYGCALLRWALLCLVVFCEATLP